MILITPGEPAGIGPDITIQLAQLGKLQDCVVVADLILMQQRAKMLGASVTFVPYVSGGSFSSEVVPVISIPLIAPSACGRPNTANAAYVMNTLQCALEKCQNGFDAWVTGPVSKQVICEAGIPFQGHTEFLAHATRTSDVVMMLVSPVLRVALVTTHLPLIEVPKAITRERLQRTFSILDQGLQRYFRIAHPVLYVCGLNPHAGEGGYLGREEIDIILPAIEHARAQGLEIVGPLSADTIFNDRTLKSADVIVAMYHDQGLPVLKQSGFGQSVNVTLGLPFIRTSVDHGTAFALAGTGKADPGSMNAAITLARTMVKYASA